LPGQRAQVLADQLDVINARIDGGREMLFIARRLVERGANARAQLGSELRARAAKTGASSSSFRPA
jgi:hypothetical protein